jgi:hypothetical protein
MFFNGSVYPCCVRDVTNHGADLRLNGLNILSSEFGISFDNFRTMRRCRLIWRRRFCRRGVRNLITVGSR